MILVPKILPKICIQFETPTKIVKEIVSIANVLLLTIKWTEWVILN